MTATLWAVFAALATASAVTPIEKVITLLEDLEAEILNDGSAESANYDTFACYCKDTTDAKSSSITESNDNIDGLSATIGDDTATKVEKEGEVVQRKADQNELAAKLQTNAVLCQKEQTEYEAEDADLSKAISSLKSAINAMDSSKSASLLQGGLGESVARTFALADALGFVVHPLQKQVSALLQGKQTVDPDDSSFKFHSQGIIDTMDGLLKEFVAKKKGVDDEWAKTSKSCTDTKASLEQQMDENSAAISKTTETIGKLTVAIAKSRENLVLAEANLKDDQLYLKDLTAVCEARAKDWDQRTQMRAGEVNAISKALAILKNKVQTADQNVNERALLLQKAAPSFFQATAVQSRAHGLLQRVRGGGGLALQLRQANAADLLRREARRLNSPILVSIAMHVASDPFDKVKGLIQGLVERLLREATAEATKKGFCDTELGKASTDRDNRHAGVEKLSVELGALEVKEDELEAEISKLIDSIASLTTTLEQGAEMRADEKKANAETLAEAKAGHAAVSEALVILKAFYKQSAKATLLVQGKPHTQDQQFSQLHRQLNMLDARRYPTFLQVHASPIDEDTQGPGFEGAYEGRLSSSGGILGLIEVIKTDFERTIKTVTAEEKHAAADFVEFDRASKSDISGKGTKKTLDEQDLATTKNSLRTKMDDLKTEQSLLDKALAVLEELKPVCIDTGMSYAERVEKREEEIVALKNALCILDTEGVESDCK